MKPTNPSRGGAYTVDARSGALVSSDSIAPPEPAAPAASKSPTRPQIRKTKPNRSRK
jgi:hypothetical protein